MARTTALRCNTEFYFSGNRRPRFRAPSPTLTLISTAGFQWADTLAVNTTPTRLPILNAPHRLLFFIGVANLGLAMGWWALWLAGLQLGKPLPAPALPPAWLHGLWMQYLVLPSFIFGFLLTVFPRWMGLPALPRWQYAGVGGGLFGAQIALLAASAGWSAGLRLGLLLAILGWGFGLWVLGRLLLQERGRTWHALSCWSGLLVGWLGLLAFAAAAVGGDIRWHALSVSIGSFGLLLPVYASVAHRMFPFFAGNVVPGYQAWRPPQWLAILWGLCLLHLAGENLQQPLATLLADTGLLLLSLYTLWRWWPRGPKPALLAVLFYGLAWWPLAMLLYLLQDIAALAGQPGWLERAPLHALAVGLFGSLLVAMVTRVTQGHSGRALVMPLVAWIALLGLQLVAVLRILAPLLDDPWRWHTVAAAAWLLVLAPWLLRLAWIYCRPRADGKPD